MINKLSYWFHIVARNYRWTFSGGEKWWKTWLTFFLSNNKTPHEQWARGHAVSSLTRDDGDNGVKSRHEWWIRVAIAMPPPIGDNQSREMANETFERPYDVCCCQTSLSCFCLSIIGHLRLLPIYHRQQRAMLKMAKQSLHTYTMNEEWGMKCCATQHSERERQADSYTHTYANDSKQWMRKEWILLHL